MKTREDIDIEFERAKEKALKLNGVLKTNKDYLVFINYLTCRVRKYELYASELEEELKQLKQERI